MDYIVREVEQDALGGHPWAFGLDGGERFVLFLTPAAMNAETLSEAWMAYEDCAATRRRRTPAPA